jgi:hypothetical protein
MKIKFASVIIIFLILCSINLFAQRNINDCIGVKLSHHHQSLSTGKTYDSKSPTDTLKPPGFLTGSDTLYKYVEGGYSFGVNQLSDRAFAQVYRVSPGASYIVDGVALWVGAKKIVGDTGTLNVIIYKLDGPGTDTSGAVNNAPDSIDHLLTMTTDMIDTTGFTFLSFTVPYIAYVDYAAGIDLTQMGDDTLGLITTRFYDADSTQLSWNKYADNTWHTVLENSNWGKDLDLGIFIIVDQSSANVNDNYFIDGIKLDQTCPNPALGSTLVQYEINEAAAVTLDIYNMQGKKVMTLNEGFQTKGQHQLSLCTATLGSGTYFYSLSAGSHRLTKKMTVVK